MGFSRHGPPSSAGREETTKGNRGGVYASMGLDELDVALEFDRVSEAFIFSVCALTAILIA